MTDAAIVHVTHAAHAAATATAGPAAEGGGVSSLLIVAVAGMAVFLTAGVVRTALRVFSALLAVAVRVGVAVIALGFGALVLGVVYVANMVFEFAPT